MKEESIFMILSGILLILEIIIFTIFELWHNFLDIYGISLFYSTAILIMISIILLIIKLS